MIQLATRTRYAATHRFRCAAGFPVLVLAIATTRLAIDGQAMPAGRLIVVPPGVPYALTDADAAWSEDVVLCPAPAAWPASWPQTAPSAQRITPACRAAFTQAVDDWLGAHPQRQALADNGFLGLGILSMPKPSKLQRKNALGDLDLWPSL